MRHISSPYSSIGKTRLNGYVSLFALNLIVLILSARVNQFQGFFFIADLFPLGLSITTFVVLFLMMMLDFSLHNSLTARPPFEIGVLSVLSIFWLAFNAFSTSRWRHVPLACSAIPSGFSDERAWCRDVQALKAFVWIEWLAVLVILVMTLRFVIREHLAGNTYIWTNSLSRYQPYTKGNSPVMNERASTFWVPESTFFGR